MKTFRDILNESTKQYKFRLKTVMPFDDEMLRNLKRRLGRYGLVECSDVKETPAHNNPIDFAGFTYTRVYIIDFIITTPVSAYLLKRDIVKQMGVPSQYVIIAAENEPNSYFTRTHLQSIEDLRREGQIEGLTPIGLLDTQGEYYEFEISNVSQKEIAGNQYNQSLLKQLANTKVPNGLGDFEPGEDFNRDKPGVKPVYSADREPIKVYTHRGPYGNFDESGRMIGMVFVDSQGRRVVKTVDRSIP